MQILMAGDPPDTRIETLLARGLMVGGGAIVLRRSVVMVCEIGTHLCQGRGLTVSTRRGTLGAD